MSDVNLGAFYEHVITELNNSVNIKINDIVNNTTELNNKYEHVIAEVNNKADKKLSNLELSNIPQAIKDNFMQYNIPDYSSVIEIKANNWVVPAKGIIFATNDDVKLSYSHIKINGATIGFVYSETSTQYDTSMYAIVDKGDVFSYKWINYAYFYRFKGN